MNKHTEGPWTIYKDQWEKDLYRIYTGQATAKDLIVELKGSYGDASLIAGAPDMLEALHIARMQIASDLNTRVQQTVEREANNLILEVIEKAIKKAEGTQNG